MPHITILPPHEAQKIAAGEVVERPASIVKELVENSLDAGATRVDIFARDGGRASLRIVDNGCGMSPEDARLCTENHATSKITSLNDLETISTFGFRGEALASICAVSDLTLVTRQADQASGIKRTFKGGMFVAEEAVGCPVGSDVLIDHLFENVPARKKFLKTRETEFNQIVSLFQALCLAYPTVHFTLQHDGLTSFSCPAVETAKQRIVQLWDHKAAAHMLELKAPAQAGTMRIEGIISTSSYVRYDRSSIFLFVNNRWIKHQKLTTSLLKGYLNVLPTGRYPAAAIFITVPPHEVDVNVHPRKQEVQFLHPRILETMLKSQVTTTLEEKLSRQLEQPQMTTTPSWMSATPTHSRSSWPSAGTQEFKNTYSGFVPQHQTPAFTMPLPSPDQDLEEILDVETAREDIPQRWHLPPLDMPRTADEPEEIRRPEPTMQQEALPTSTPLVLGVLHNTYLLLEHPEGLFMVDQHAAHERVLYEMFSSRFREVPTIALLFPVTITLSAADYACIEPHLAIFEQQGIIVEPFGQQQLVVTSTPVSLKNVQLDELIKEVVGWIHETTRVDEADFFKKISEKLRAQMACKAAVKAGDVLTSEQITALLRDLEQVDNRFTCPHGRPTSWLLRTAEIEKQFKRRL